MVIVVAAGTSASRRCVPRNGMTSMSAAAISAAVSATKRGDALADCRTPWGLTRADYDVLITPRAAGEPCPATPPTACER